MKASEKPSCTVRTQRSDQDSFRPLFARGKTAISRFYRASVTVGRRPCRSAVCLAWRRAARDARGRPPGGSARRKGNAQRRRAGGGDIGQGGHGPALGCPTGNFSWISSLFEKRRSDTHRRNISVCRLKVDRPYSGRGGPPVVRDAGKKLDQVALWLAHNAPYFTVRTHLIGSLRPLTLLLIVVDLNGIY